MKKTLLERFVEDPKNRRLFLQERSILEVTELIEARLRELGINRSELARKLGKTKGWVTQLLDGEANKTIRTVADVFAVLGFEYHSSTRPIQIGKARAVEEKETNTIVDATVLPNESKTFRFWDGFRVIPQTSTQAIPIGA